MDNLAKIKQLQRVVAELHKSALEQEAGSQEYFDLLHSVSEIDEVVNSLINETVGKK